MFYCFLFFFCIYRSMSLSKEVRMLQLNHYQLSRSLKHVGLSFQKIKHIWFKVLLHLPFLLLFLVLDNQKELLTLMLIVYSYLRFKFQQLLYQKVSLVYTKRVLRLYLAIFIVYGVCFYLLWDTSYLLWSCIFFMCMNVWIVFFVSVFLYPVENMIRMYYVYLARCKMKKVEDLLCIGVVGSYGKTSCKNILYHLLSRKYYCLKSEKSFNNLMGNTITIRKHLKRVHDVFIAEMGSDHVGEIHRLMSFLKPQCVMITSIGNQHMETFGSQEKIVKEKMSPLLDLNEEGIAFLNIDNIYIKAHQNDGCCRKITFGEDSESDYCLKRYELYEWGSRFTVSIKGKEYDFETTLLGYYNIINMTGAIAVADTLGVSIEKIRDALFYMQPIEHRLKSIRHEHYTLIDNAYNSNIYSFQNSLSILKQISKYRIFITPGLIDLKEDERINNELMDHVGGCVDEVIVVGYKNRAYLVEGLKRNHFENYRVVDTMEEALFYVDHLDKEDFVVLIENDIDKDYMNAD